MNSPIDKSIIKPLVGRQLRSVVKESYGWDFEFDDSTSVQTESCWRYIGEKRILVTSEDHGVRFGLPAPIDAAEQVLAHAMGQSVVGVMIERTTGDLYIEFAHGYTLQMLQMSSGYEAWHLFIDGAATHCIGGGDIAHFPKAVG